MFWKSYIKTSFWNSWLLKKNINRKQKSRKTSYSVGVSKQPCTWGQRFPWCFSTTNLHFQGQLTNKFKNILRKEILWKISCKNTILEINSCFLYQKNGNHGGFHFEVLWYDLQFLGLFNYFLICVWWFLKKKVQNFWC